MLIRWCIHKEHCIHCIIHFLKLISYETSSWCTISIKLTEGASSMPQQTTSCVTAVASGSFCTLFISHLFLFFAHFLNLLCLHLPPVSHSSASLTSSPQSVTPSSQRLRNFSPLRELSSLLFCCLFYINYTLPLVTLAESAELTSLIPIFCFLFRSLGF